VQDELVVGRGDGHEVVQGTEDEVRGHRGVVKNVQQLNL
jgi:hypothetical protein